MYDRTTPNYAELRLKMRCEARNPYEEERRRGVPPRCRCRKLLPGIR